jgi:hypothetical protein
MHLSWKLDEVSYVSVSHGVVRRVAFGMRLDMRSPVFGKGLTQPFESLSGWVVVDRRDSDQDRKQPNASRFELSGMSHATHREVRQRRNLHLLTSQGSKQVNQRKGFKCRAEGVRQKELRRRKCLHLRQDTTGLSPYSRPMGACTRLNTPSRR